jgi:predicted HTH transcriptional regulator
MALEELLTQRPGTLSGSERIQLFKAIIGSQSFTRKDYLNNFKEITTATASRDLKEAVTNRLLKKTGDKRTSSYRFL